MSERSVQSAILLEVSQSPSTSTEDDAHALTTVTFLTDSEQMIMGLMVPAPP